MENTLISSASGYISLGLSITLCGAMFFMGRLSNRVATLERDLIRVRDDSREKWTDLKELRKDLEEIKSDVKYLRNGR